MADLEACLDLDCDPAKVRVARAFVAQTLLQWDLGAHAESAVLVTSELVANAVLHARSDIRLTIRADGLEYVRVEVADENSRLPTHAACPDDALSGRGLGLVDIVSTAWGVTRTDVGKVVWAELGQVPVHDDGECLDARGATADDELRQLLDSA